MKCKYCNAEVTPNVRFCTSCGADLSKLGKCARCGEFIEKGEPVCPHCGAEQPQIIQRESGSKNGVWFLLSILLFCAIGGAGYYFFIKDSGNTMHGPQVDTDTIEEIVDSVEMEYDIHSIEGIKARLNEIFSKGLNMPDDAVVSKYFSQEFKQLYSQVEKIDETLDGPGFWNGSIWDGRQDDDPNNFEIVRINISSPTDVYFDVNLIFDDGSIHSENKVSMSLLFENGNWFIDDILDGQYKDQMKEYIERNNSTPDYYSFVGKVYKGGGNGGGLNTEMTISFIDDNQCTCVSDWYQAYSLPKTLKGQYEIKNNMVVVKCKDGDTEHLFEFEITSNGRILEFDHSDLDMGGTMGNNFMSLEMQ